MKVTLTLALSKIFSSDLPKSKMYLYSIVLTLIPVFLVLLQPDLGTAFVFFVIFLITCFVSKLGFPYALLTVCLGLALVFLFRDTIFHDYQISRLASFLNPLSDPEGEGWSVRQALIAIGSGGIYGKGFLNGTQSKMGFLPNTQYSDFIFAVIGEEFGLIGSLILISLFAFLILACLNLSFKLEDYFGKVAIIGICGFIFFQIFINIGMNIGLMPITGIPLPFISYGGSALISNLTGMGIIYNAQINRKTLEF
jgi:rod shape determining protein RodA